MFSRQNADKYGYLGVVGNLQAKQISLINFNATCYITQSLTFFDCLFIYVPEKNVFKYPAFFFLFFKERIIWTGAVGPVMSISVVFISFAKKISHRFLLIFFSITEDIVLNEIMK